jgi:acetyltransferase
VLTELESKQILSHYGIPTVETRVAKNEDEAVKHASEIGYPIVLKVFSETITHKSDVGGVKLNLHDEQSVRSAFRTIRSSVTQKAGGEQFLGVTVQPMVRIQGYELILGSSVDPQFGPVILFGSGGQFVEVYRDHAVALPPLNSTLAQRLMERTRIFKALKGVRGRPPVDLAALGELMVRFSQLVVEQPWIAEIDLNPLLASSEGLLALDARVLLHDPTLRPDQLPRPAIRPYPSQYVSPFTMKDGTEVTLRPICPEDEPLVGKFHETISDRSVYLRYFSSLSLSSRVAHERLARICFVDYDRVIALVVDHKNKATGQRQILGVGRLIKLNAKNEAEVAILVSDQYQKQGLGIELLRCAVQVARDENLGSVSAEMLRDNMTAQRLFKKVGFRLRPPADSSCISAVLDL